MVGVEENPQFGHFKAPQNDSLNGFVNPAFSRSIDSVCAPTAFSGVTRINPLSEMGHISEGKCLNFSLELVCVLVYKNKFFHRLVNVWFETS